MDRITLRIEERNLERVEKLVEDGEFPNRSEVIRAGIRSVVREYGRERALTDGGMLAFEDFDSCGLCGGALENDLDRDTGVCSACVGGEGGE